MFAALFVGFVAVHVRNLALVVLVESRPRGMGEIYFSWSRGIGEIPPGMGEICAVYP
jgi:hypothetical protein